MKIGIRRALLEQGQPKKTDLTVITYKVAAYNAKGKLMGNSHWNPDIALEDEKMLAETGLIADPWLREQILNGFLNEAEEHLAEKFGTTETEFRREKLDGEKQLMVSGGGMNKQAHEKIKAMRVFKQLVEEDFENWSIECLDPVIGEFKALYNKNNEDIELKTQVILAPGIAVQIGPVGDERVRQACKEKILGLCQSWEEDMKRHMTRPRVRKM